MCAKQVDLWIKGSGGRSAGTASLDGIPDDLWGRFVERANEIMPEKAPDAWASMLSEVVASVGGGGKTHTLILTDIPLDAVQALDGLASEVDESADGLVAQLYRYAQGDSLHLVRVRDEQHQPSHLLYLYGIPQRHWDAWGKFAETVDQTPESMFGLLLQLVEQGSVVTTRTQDGTPPPNSNGSGLGRQEQHATASDRPN